MDFAQIAGLISNIGFPIAMCVLLYNLVTKMNDQHKAEMEKITESLNNTIALTELAGKLDNLKVAS